MILFLIMSVNYSIFQSMDVESKNENRPSPSGAANIVRDPVISEVHTGAAAVEESVVNGAIGGEPSTSSIGASERDTSWQKELPEVGHASVLLR
jgi:hypothetical protein